MRKINPYLFKLLWAGCPVTWDQMRASPTQEFGGPWFLWDISACAGKAKAKLCTDQGQEMSANCRCTDGSNKIDSKVDPRTTNTHTHTHTPRGWALAKVKNAAESCWNKAILLYTDVLHPSKKWCDFFPAAKKKKSLLNQFSLVTSIWIPLFYDEVNILSTAGKAIFKYKC